jgi:hypothetical protein
MLVPMIARNWLARLVAAFAAIVVSLFMTYGAWLAWEDSAPRAFEDDLGFAVFTREIGPYIYVAAAVAAAAGSIAAFIVRLVSRPAGAGQIA